METIKYNNRPLLAIDLEFINIGLVVAIPVLDVTIFLSKIVPKANGNSANNNTVHNLKLNCNPHYLKTYFQNLKHISGYIEPKLELEILDIITTNIIESNIADLKNK